MMRPEVVAEIILDRVENPYEERYFVRHRMRARRELCHAFGHMPRSCMLSVLLDCRMVVASIGTSTTLKRKLEVLSVQDVIICMILPPGVQPLCTTKLCTGYDTR